MDKLNGAVMRVYPWVDRQNKQKQGGLLPMVIMAKIVIIIIASGKIEWASVYPWVDRQNKQKQGGSFLIGLTCLPCLSHDDDDKQSTINNE